MKRHIKTLFCVCLAGFWGQLMAEDNPALPRAKFELLPFGTVRAEGWLQQQIVRDAKTGVFADIDRLCTAVQRRVFKSQAAGVEGDNSNAYWFYDGAYEGYWIDSLARTAVLSGDERSMKKAREFVDYILSSQEEGGYLGIYPPRL